MAVSTFSFAKINGPDVLNSVTAGDQFRPAVVATSGGAGIVFFDDGATIAARRINSSGEPTGAQVTVSAGSASDDPKATLLANGNVVVTWQDGVGNTKILGRIYDANLNPVSGILIFEPADSVPFREPDIAATPDGGFIVVSHDELSATDNDIFIKKFSATGMAGASTFFAPSNTLDRDPSVAVLPNGNVAVAWERQVGADTQIWTALYNSALGVIRAPTLLDNFGSINQDVSVSARPNNTFTVSYQDNFSGNSNITTYQFDSTGVPTEFVVIGSNTGPENDASAATSVDGYQVVANEDQTDAAAWDVRASILTPTGTVGALNTVLEGGGGYQYRPSVTWVDPSTVQLAYTTFLSASAGDGGGSGIAVSRFSVIHTTTGDGTAETLNGDGLIDVIIADAGADNLNGFGGNDFLFGGAGNDQLAGGVGADILDGGADYDFARYDSSATGVVVRLDSGQGLNGDAQGDLLSNIEGLIGSAQQDFLIGSAASNALLGLNGNDWLYGQGGADELRGGAGSDQLIGGSGADLMYGEAGNDQFWTLAADFEAGVFDVIYDFGESNTNFDYLRFEGVSAANLIIGDNAGNAVITTKGLNYSGGIIVLNFSGVQLLDQLIFA